MEESNKRNGLARVPTCANWPPPWLLPPAPVNADLPSAITPAPALAAPISATPPAASQRLAELRAFVDSLARNHPWRDAWNRRHQSPVGWESPVRVARDALDGIATAVQAGDMASLDSRERWLRRVVSGEPFDSAAQIPADDQIVREPETVRR